MTIIVNDVSLLLGHQLDYIERGHVVIEDGLVKSAGSGPYKSNSNSNDNSGQGMALDGRGFLVIPGFINAHTHIADSIGKDIAAGSRLDKRVHPVFGAKKKILEKSTPAHLRTFIRNAAVSMMKKGIVAFADFREGGIDGVRLLKGAIDGLPIKCIALGRSGYYSTPDEPGGIPPGYLQEAEDVVRISDGLGISGANENTDSSLSQYRKIVGGKLLAIHAAESRETVLFSKEHAGGRTEVERIMRFMKPDFMVHMTNASDDDIASAAKSSTGIVVCPRANGVLGAGIPRVHRMLKAGCIVALGTDNVMLNSPDITRELDYAWKTSRAAEQKEGAPGSELIEPREILKMATVNAGDILKLNSGCIEAGRAADLLFIDRRHADLYPMHDPHAAIIQRLSEGSITSVMINGRFVEEIN
ncbi:MAG TPA: amidohydrolase family protein [Nitrososphaera sp.]|nr:amidohydrolase family protein [Nitrososphaera sp.]